MIMAQKRCFGVDELNLIMQGGIVKNYLLQRTVVFDDELRIEAYRFEGISNIRESVKI